MISGQCPESIKITESKLKLVFDPIPNPVPTFFTCNGIEYEIERSGNAGNFFTNPGEFPNNSLDEILTFETPEGTIDCIYEGGIYVEPSLPVEIAIFKANLEEQDIIINWTTLSEEYNAGFDIQQSYDGSSFLTIGGVKGAGYSEVQQDYGFIDEGVKGRALGSHSYYRLVQIDYDGVKTYSEILTVDLGLDFEKFEITKITGWGASDPMLKVFYYAPEFIRKINFQLSDIEGNIIFRQSIYPEPGLNFLEIDIRGYEQPFYFFALDNGKEIIGDKIAVGINFR